MRDFIVTLFIISLFFALFQTLVPWYAETFGPAEENIGDKLQAEKDAKSCAPYLPAERGVTNVLYCHCSDNEKQVPGRCNEKYNKNLCPGTEYQIIKSVTYCDYHGELMTPEEYERLNP